MNPSLNTLFGKHILLGITGGIAAYKSAELTRRLRDAGAQVRVVMTRSATEFVTPLTFQALSGHAVHTELLDETAEAGMGHIALARWADAVLIAPASANTLARLAQGRGDDLLTTLCLATEAPIAYAPSMNRVMWNAQATRANCETLLARGYTQLGPASGAHRRYTSSKLFLYYPWTAPPLQICCTVRRRKNSPLLLLTQWHASASVLYTRRSSPSTVAA